MYSQIEFIKKNFSSHTKCRYTQILVKLMHEKPCLILIMGNKSSVFDPYNGKQCLIPIMGNKTSVFDPFCVTGKIRVNLYHTRY